MVIYVNELVFSTVEPCSTLQRFIEGVALVVASINVAVERVFEPFAGEVNLKGCYPLLLLTTLGNLCYPNMVVLYWMYIIRLHGLSYLNRY